jgi:hypothetical protein
LESRNKRVLNGVRVFSPLLQAYEAGYSKEEIKGDILQRLEPEFDNPTVLDRYGIDLLAAESVNITKVRMNRCASEIYDKSMMIRRELLSKDKNICAEVCSQWEEQIGKALSLYWSALKFEHNKGDLPIDEYAYELLRNIGGLIEGTFQVYLKELLHIAFFAHDKNVSHSEIAALSLGEVVKKLSEMLGSVDIFTLSPWLVPLNQWRNIAQHLSIDTEQSLIVCRYGAKNQHVIKLERQELMDVANSIFLLYSAIRTSHTIFFLDHADNLISHCKGFKRKDLDEQFQFCVGAASQGFEVVDLSIREDMACAELVDVTFEEAMPRGIHASQFVYQLWMITKSDSVIIKYISKSGSERLTATARGEDCKKIFEGEEGFSYLASVVNFEFQ